MPTITIERFKQFYYEGVGMSPSSAAQNPADPFTDALTEQLFYDGGKINSNELIRRLEIEYYCIGRTIAILEGHYSKRTPKAPKQPPSDGSPQSQRESWISRLSKQTDAEALANAAEIAQARLEYGNSDCKIDDDALVSRSDNRQNIWVQAWVFLQNPPVPTSPTTSDDEATSEEPKPQAGDTEDPVSNLLEQLTLGKTVLIDLPPTLTSDDVEALAQWVAEQDPSDPDAERSVAAQRALIQAIADSMNAISLNDHKPTQPTSHAPDTTTPRYIVRVGDGKHRRFDVVDTHGKWVCSSHSREDLAEKRAKELNLQYISS